MEYTRGDSDFLSWMLLNQTDMLPDINDNALKLDSSIDPFPTSESAVGLPSLPSTTSESEEIKRANSETLSNMTDIERKREERKIKNREIAKNCRKRKREKISAMEKELRQLREDKRNLELKLAHFQQNKSSNGVVEITEEPQQALPTREARNREYGKIQILLNQFKEASDKKNLEDVDSIKNKIKSKLSLCEEMHSDFGKARKGEIEFHLMQLEKLLIPNQLTKISLWSLQQEDDFYDEKTTTKTFGGGLWKTICTEFNLTKKQKKELLNMRDSIKTQRQNIYECLKILNELKGRINENFGSLKSQMQKLVSITSPIQQARFLMWIEQNQACMFMLNSLWEKEKAGKGIKKEEVKLENSVEFKIKPLKPDGVKVSTEAMEAALQTGKTVQAMKNLIEEQTII